MNAPKFWVERIDVGKRPGDRSTILVMTGRGEPALVKFHGYNVRFLSRGWLKRFERDVRDLDAGRASFVVAPCEVRWVAERERVEALIALMRAALGFSEGT